MSIPADDSRRSPAETAHEQALGEISDVLLTLERNHKRFMHDTYYAGDTLRLI